jgi:hypothetical protein
MKLLIYLQIKPQSEIRYSAKFVKALKESIPDLLVYEADQASSLEQTLIGTKLIEQATEICLYIEANDGQSLGSTNKVFEKLRKSNQHILAFQIGNHAQVKATLKMIGTEVLNVPEVSLAKAFLTKA